jgi:RNA polymerase-interacting CarD/CdnL/TRCF family regulator
MLEMKNVPTIREALSQGLNVMLPKELDNYMLMKDRHMSDEAILQILSWEVAEAEDISATEAEDIIIYTLKQLGVDLNI